ncbi:MAG: tRNA (adenosine(37)-N6)-threonylcarbamoyltransferase complex ATPase subunit type 1 TsaE [Lentisphaerota bacterium]
MNILEIENIESRSEQETEDFAAAMAETLPPGTVIALHGDLGAGKTVFSRGFARGLGISEPVSSPTYTIIQEYPLDRGGWFFHLDLYRIENSASALAFGVNEYLDEPAAYTMIEWPERIADILPAHTIHVHLHHRGDTLREIAVAASGLDELLQ